MEQLNLDKDWRQEIPDYLKIKDGESEQFVFLDEGTKIINNFGENCILFKIKIIGTGRDKIWLVKTKSYTLLKQIKDLGKLTGATVELKRKGATLKNTIYSIARIAVD